MTEPKYKVIKVIVEETYVIEMHNDEVSAINGWTLNEVVKDWFEKFPMNQFHASRDARKSDRKFISSSVEDLKQTQK